jgi:nitrite reductase/ring-hydroxylating ferredoxin subunit
MNGTQTTRIKRIGAGGLFIMLTFISFQACEEDWISPIPSAPVHITLNLDFADIDLIPSLATKCITARRLETDRIGFGGILVINGYSANGAINLYAYDLACPVEADRNNKVAPDDQGKAACPHCGAVYNIAYGSGIPESGSKHPLRSYPVQPVGGNKYTIQN